MTSAVNIFYKRLHDRHMKEMRMARYNWAANVADQGNRTDLEHRLYWRVPASVFYKARKKYKEMMGKPRTWQRYGEISKAKCNKCRDTGRIWSQIRRKAPQHEYGMVIQDQLVVKSCSCSVGIVRNKRLNGTTTH